MPTGRPRTHEGTLRRVAMDAKRNYSGYKRAYKNETAFMERHFDSVQRYEEIVQQLGRTAAGEAVSHSWRSRFVPDNVERVRSATFIDAGAQHYKTHIAEYHDLAVVEAFLEGVIITVQQPLEIGQKTEQG